MVDPDHYKTLGVPKNATRRQIQQTYRALAKRYHPDSRQTASSAVFREIATAYHVLSHPKLRKAYDAQQTGYQSETHPYSGQAMNTDDSHQPFTVWQGPSFPMTPYRSLNLFLGGLKLLLMLILMITPFLIPFILLYFYFQLFRP
jgi:curved DNA-binding protein CbpA